MSKKGLKVSLLITDHWGGTGKRAIHLRNMTWEFLRLDHILPDALDYIVQFAERFWQVPWGVKMQ